MNLEINAFLSRMPDKKAPKFINDHYIKYLCQKKIPTLEAHANMITDQGLLWRKIKAFKVRTF